MPLRDLGKQPGFDKAASADAALAAALLAAKTEAAAAQERVRAAALALERERTAADALARRIAETERYFLSAGQQPVFPAGPQPAVRFVDMAESSSRQATPDDAGSRPDPTDPLVAQLHLQAVGIQNIRALVSIVLDSTSTSYGRWRDQFLLALRRYALDDHVLLGPPATTQDGAWFYLDRVVVTWLLGTLSLELRDLVRSDDGSGTARQAWLTLERRFLGNAETRALRLDASFRSFEQGDLSMDEYCRRMKGMADELADLGCPVSDKVLVINLLRGLNSNYEVLKTIIPRMKPFPTFLEARDDLLLDELNRGLRPGSSSLTSSTALVAIPPASSAPPATSLLGAPPPGPSGGGGAWRPLSSS